jgi:hypothetical protein
MAEDGAVDEAAPVSAGALPRLWELIRYRPLNVLVPGLTERLGIDARRLVRESRGTSAFVVSWRYPMTYAAGRGVARAWRSISVDIAGEDLCYPTAYRHRAARRSVDPGTHLLRITGTDNTNGDLVYITLRIEVPHGQPTMVTVYPALGRGRPSRIIAKTYGPTGSTDATVQVVTYDEPGR